MSRFRCIFARRRAAFLGKERTAADQLGMTLIEIMVVIAIIGMLVGTVAVVAVSRMKKARIVNTKQIITTVKNALQEYSLDHPDPCPKDLKVLYEERLINKEPKDAWGRELIFICPGEHDKDSADISSGGEDRKDGTEDDINSWEI
ncbi:MAG: type II secretion system protein GspG [Pseudomonadota bacterium]